MVKKFFCLIILFSILLLASCSNESSKEDNLVDKASYFESGDFTMLGKENKAGFIISKNADLVANRTNKYMWHLWGDQDFHDKEFKVTGVNIDTGDEETLVTSLVTGPVNGADFSIPSNMTFPSKGTWELSVFVDGKLFNKMTVEVS
ncbi:DUF4871 domain-containing protein [Halobacillus shinanisalinarum]|uniref:DUF4871 domain-containing protein n=1 Tax=Halobacillus shinanisalinarum TaxID=2932258 RepID=A0ABY4GY77_9BACI|nr:DUF4871 domain-containing protein [Halobacillus shinanisalinarum]UOQ93118.1 DUF4871 domain-containing protein [Halobacillus shinanisalinarum]